MLIRCPMINGYANIHPEYTTKRTGANSNGSATVSAVPESEPTNSAGVVTLKEKKPVGVLLPQS